MERTPSQTEDAEERGFVEEVDEDRRGEADSVDPEGAGDIADEGSAHRG
jgi:hypothetical protein